MLPGRGGWDGTPVGCSLSCRNLVPAAAQGGKGALGKLSTHPQSCLVPSRRRSVGERLGEKPAPGAGKARTTSGRAAQVFHGGLLEGPTWSGVVWPARQVLTKEAVSHLEKGRGPLHWQGWRGIWLPLPEETAATEEARPQNDQALPPPPTTTEITTDGTGPRGGLCRRRAAPSWPLCSKLLQTEEEKTLLPSPPFWKRDLNKHFRGFELTWPAFQ